MPQFKQSFCIPCFAGKEWKETEAVVKAAAGIGYPACEIWFRDEKTFSPLCSLAKDLDMVVASMCGHGGGLNRQEEHHGIREQLLMSIDVAQKNGIPNLICFSGNRDNRSDEECAKIVAEGLALVVREAEAANVTLNLELLNSKVDHPGYQCDHTAWGVEVCRKLNSPHVKLLYDVYHMQVMEGDLCRTIERNIAHIGHFHTAGNPGRNDPDDTQEINYGAIAAVIRRTGFTGYVAHEFWPRGDKLKALERVFRLFQE